MCKRGVNTDKRYLLILWGILLFVFVVSYALTSIVRYRMAILFASILLLPALYRLLCGYGSPSSPMGEGLSKEGGDGYIIRDIPWDGLNGDRDSLFLPICARCKKIRDQDGIWNHLEEYFRMHFYIDFSHSICPECSERLYQRTFNNR